VKPIAKPYWEIKHTIIRGEDENVTCRIQNGGAYLAVFQVPLNKISHCRRKGIVQIVGDVVPDMFALDDHRSHLRLGVAAFNLGARSF
jgi:hypothetical protein